MKKTFRSLSFIAAFALIATVIPLLRGGGITANAAGDFTMDGTTLTAYTGSASSVTIPEGVVTIASNAFKDKSMVTSITLPSTLTTIKNYAFRGSSVTKIELPSSVSSISSYAFDGCTSLTGIYSYNGSDYFSTYSGVLYTKGGTTLLRYPPARTGTSYSVLSQTTAVGNSAFDSCSNLKTVTLPEGLKAIRMYAFYKSTGLTSVNIPATCATIDEYAFTNCSSLATLHIKAQNPGTIGTDAFKNAPVATIHYDGTSENWSASSWKSVFGSGVTVNYGFTVSGSVFKAYNGSGGVVTIPSGITEIGVSAFNGKSAVTGVIIPDGVTTIGNNAFKGTSVSSLDLPKSVKTIPAYTFDGMTKLTGISVSSDNATFKAVSGVLFNKAGTSLVRYPQAKSGTSYTVPSGVKIISNSAFYEASKLTSVTLPESVTTINGFAFGKCTGITSFTIPAKVANVASDAFGNCTALATLNIKSASPTVNIAAFKGSTAITTVNYEGSSADWDASDWKPAVTHTNASPNAAVSYAFTIEDNVLKKYNGVGGTVTVPSGVTQIGDNAFSGKSAVTAVILPDTVTKIGSAAFSGTSVTSITIPKSVTDIHVFAFDGAANLQEIAVDSSNSQYKSVSGVLFNKAGTTLFRYPVGKTATTYTVPSGVKTIGNSAFFKAAKLTSVTLPEGVTNINLYAFNGCAGLTSFTVPASVTVINDSVFSNCSALKTLNIYAANPSVGSDFCKNVTTITTVNYEGYAVGWESSGWKTALDKSGSTYTVNCAFTVTDGVLTGYTGSRSAVIIPSGVTEIGQGVFRDKTNVISVKIPDTVRKIGKNAFKNTAITGITIPASVEEIGVYVFDDCDSLTDINVNSSNSHYKSVSGVLFNKTGTTLLCYPAGRTATSYTVPSGVTTIGNSAFYYCANLTSVTLPEGVEVLDEYALCGCLKLSSVTIPSTVRRTEYRALGSCSNLHALNINSIAPTTVSTNTFSGSDNIDTVNYAGSLKQWNQSNWKAALPSDIILNCAVSGPEITQQPQSKTITEGESLTLEVKAEGTGLTYQWFYQKKGQTTWSTWKNRTHASETVTPNATWNGIELYCEITDADGHSTTTDTVTITVNPAPFDITTQPANQYIILGKSVTVSVKATGSGLTYQWYYKKKGQSSFSVWNNRTHASETCTPNATWDGIQLYCVVKDGSGATKTTNTITVSVLSIATQPKSQTIAKGSSVTVSVKATGSGLKYQWYYKKKGASGWSVWNNRTHASETVTPNDTWDGIQLYCKVTDGAGNSVSSNTATITFGTSSITINTQPASQSILLGQSLTLSVKATGSSLKYQWYYKKKGASDWSVWNNRTHASETVTPNATWDGIQLYCKVTDGAGNSVNSAAATISVLSIATQPQSQTVTKGSSVTLYVKATGSGLKYQWYYRKKGSSGWSVWNGRTHASETVTPNDTWDGIQLYCKVTDGAGNTVDSDAATITLK
jgi:hypothetical protein